MQNLRRFLALLLLCTLLPYANAQAYRYYEPGPEGTLGVQQPTIGQMFELEPGERFTRVEMRLDGTPVPVSWDDSTGRVFYTPPSPLKPGTHTVDLSVDISHPRASNGYYWYPLNQRFTFVISEKAVAALPQPNVDQRRALEYVNQLRAEAGLSPLQYNVALGAAAQGHAEYLVRNRITGHYETEGAPGFFGVTPQDRASFYGYSAGASEVVHYVSLVEDAIDGWVETPYHRISLVHAATGEMGYGQAGTDFRASVIDSGRTIQSDQVVLWPYPGMNGVTTGWSGREDPDPLRLYPGTVGPVGYTITATWASGPQQLTLTAASLQDANGKSVSIMKFSPENDDHLSDTVAIMPYKPLEPDTTYTVKLAGMVDYGHGPVPYEHRWSFTTGTNGYLWLTAIRPARNTWTIEGEGFHPAMQVFLGGLPVENLNIESQNRLTFTVPTDRTASRDLLLLLPGGRELYQSAGSGGANASGSPSAFSPALMRLRIGDKSLRLNGLLADDRTLLMRESDLALLGATAERFPEMHRTYWTAGTRQGSVTKGHAVAWVNGQKLLMELPAQEFDGHLYVPVAFAEALLELPKVTILPPPMRDVSGHWAATEITQLVDDKVIAGYPDGTFRPDEQLTRAAFVKLLVAARGLPLQPGITGGFVDTRTHWSAAQGYLGAAAEAGILLAYEYAGRRFDPDGPITRGEIAVMLIRALGKDAEAVAKQLPIREHQTTLAGRTFTDPDTWAKAGHISLAVELGLVSGYKESDGSFTFRPLNPATRAEAAVLVVRMLNQQQ